MYKRLYNLGYVGYIFLLILAVIFYKERTIFTDNAYHLFFIIKDGHFTFQNYRYGAAFTQIFPLVSTWLSLSLSATLILYSTCFIFYYVLCYFLCGSVFKKPEFALILLLFNVLFASDTFFWMLSELPQGIAFMLVVLAYLSSRSTKKITPGILIFTLLTSVAIVIFFHPLMMFPYAFIILFFLFDKNKGIDRRLLFASVVFLVLGLVLKKFFFSTEYEKNAEGGTQQLIDRFPHYFRIYSNKRFLLNCLSKYYWIPVSAIAISFIYIRQRRWLRMLLCLGFLGGYLLLINVTYPGRAVAQFYIENMYLPLGLFLAVPIVIDVIPYLIENKKLVHTLFALIMITACIRICWVSRDYSARLNWLREFLAKHENEKVLVSESLVPKDLLIMTWGTPYEFWLLSTTEKGKTASIVINENVDALAWAAGIKNSYITAWGNFPYSELPEKYFNLTDTVQTYRIIK